MTIVRPFEADVLHVLHAILGDAPRDRAARLILATRPRPACFARPALNLIQGTLARGSVRLLARRGGWLRQRAVRGDRVVEGRLWERTPPEALGLEFSADSLRLLAGLVADGPAPGPVPAWAGSIGKTLGDRVLLFFAYETLRETEIGAALAKIPAFSRHGLCRLAFPADFAAAGLPIPPDLANWAEPLRAWVLEALQGPLAAAWIAAEREKKKDVPPAAMVAIARERRGVLEAFLAAVNRAGRRDLARFLLRVAGELLLRRPALEDWVGSIDFQGLRLADRQEASRAAMATLEALGTLARWEREAKGVGFFDEGYAAAQLGKSDWERAGGDGLRDRAHALLRAVNPLAGPG